LNVAGTAILLILTLGLVPLISWLSGTALGPLEIEVLTTLGCITGGAWLACFVLGEWTGNVSQVDRLWSLLPIVYTWVVAAYGDFAPRPLLMATLVTAWGLRLSYNFSRQGGYRWPPWRGHEDYRWRALRQRPGFQERWKWTLFNLAFISGYQNMLIVLFTLPSVVALQFRHVPLGWLDAVAAVVMAGMIVLESIADQQQWRYQNAKRRALEAGEPLSGARAKGFLDTGLWAFSRHPNYAAEQGIWIGFYGFSVAASGQVLNWSVAGCLLLVILFRGSAAFSEELSAAKYPQYADYQRRVPRFVPLRAELGGRPET